MTRRCITRRAFSSEGKLLRRNGARIHSVSRYPYSLPCNIDQQELAHLLSEHLQDHSEIKNVKVVRDSKGGLCAFVQCEVRLAMSLCIEFLLTYVLSSIRTLRPQIDSYKP